MSDLDKALAETQAYEELRAAHNRALRALSKREADQAHRSKIHADIAAALQSMSGSATPSAIASAIMDGKIPHVVAVL